MSTTTTTPSAGWYQDPENPGAQRWWNGTQWTADRRPPTEPAPLRPYGEQVWVPTGSPHTPWVWLLAFTPFASLALNFLVGLFLYWPLLEAGVPELLVSFAAYPVVLGLAWLFAIQDWRALGLRGFPRPNLAWMLLVPPLVYLAVRGRGLRKLGIKSTWIELSYVLCIVSVWLLNAGASYLVTRL